MFLIEKAVQEMLSLRHAELQLIQQDNQQRTFIATMAHELRSPVNVICGFSSELAKVLVPKPEFEKDDKGGTSQLPGVAGETHELVENIFEAGDHLRGVVNDVLDFNKLSSGMVEMNIEPVNIRSLMRHTTLMFSSEVKSRGLTFKLDIDKATPVYIQSDVVLLRKVLNNFISNALKFTPEGKKITVSLKPATLAVKPAAVVSIGKFEIKKIPVFSTIEKEGLIFSISDEGCGIPRGKLLSIFDAYKQASKTTTKNFGGTGLGLSIVRKIIENFGGSIMIDSEVGAGTSFKVYIPCQMNQQDNSPLVRRLATVAGDKEIEPAKFAEDIPLVMAEDSKPTVKLIMRWMARDGMEVPPICCDGQELVELATKYSKTKKSAIIFTDIHMPNKGGVQAVKEILNLSWGIPPVVVAMTASPEDLTNKQKGLDFDFVMKKPCSWQTMKKGFEDALKAMEERRLLPPRKRPKS